MLDSLVRVSRRVNENHFVSIANTHMDTPPQYKANHPAQVSCPKMSDPAGSRNQAKRCVLSILNPEPSMTQGTARPPERPPLSPSFLLSSKLMLTQPALQDTTTKRSKTQRGLTTRQDLHSHADAKNSTGHDWFPSLSS